MANPPAEHVHLLLSEPRRGTLAEAIKSLKQGVSRRLIGETEHFWLKRYYDFNVRYYDQFLEKLRYIHRNPVKRGLCESPEDWEWSSFRHYATGLEGRVEIESEWTARNREREAGRLGPLVERSTQAKRGLEWGTGQTLRLSRCTRATMTSLLRGGEKQILRLRAARSARAPQVF